MKITVIGTGYVGLVTGTCFAEVGNEVICVDIDAKKIAAMQDGKIPIYEPGLEPLFERNIAAKRLTFTTDLAAAAKDAEVLFLALPTPPGEDGSADLSYIESVAEKLKNILKQACVVVNKSTVPVGTAERVTAILGDSLARTGVAVASNPEFLREGLAVSDFMNPDRIVVGVNSEIALETMRRLYTPFTQQGSRLLEMDPRSAEMVKYAANSFLAVKISFMNEIANLCEQVGADVDAVREGVGSDGRIGNKFLYPGIGYGGSCFPKDVKALIHTADANGVSLQILKATEAVNAHQKEVLFNKINDFYHGDLTGKTFALWGLAFKPDTDDIREAPALTLIKLLTNAGANIVAYDPQAIENVQKQIAGNKKLRFSSNMYAALDGADALIIATEWEEFRSPDISWIESELAHPVVFDGRNVWSKAQLQDTAVQYFSIGREPYHGN